MAPKDASALKGRAEVALYSGDMEGARRWLDQAIEVDPFDDGAFHVRGRVRAMLGDAAGSRADRETFDRLKREQAELLALRSTLLNATSDNDARSKVVSWCFEHGRDKDGLDWATAILANDPNHARPAASWPTTTPSDPTEPGWPTSTGSRPPRQRARTELPIRRPMACGRRRAPVIDGRLEAERQGVPRSSMKRTHRALRSLPD